VVRQELEAGDLMYRRDTAFDVIARWSTIAWVTERTDGVCIVRIRDAIAFAAPTPEAGRIARRCIFLGEQVTRVLAAAGLAKIWLEFGALAGILVSPILVLLLFLAEAAVRRVFARGWERCPWPPESSHPLKPSDSARSAHVAIAGLGAGGLLSALCFVVWSSAGFRHWLGAIFALAALTALIGSVLRLRNLVREEIRNSAPHS